MATCWQRLLRVGLWSDGYETLAESEVRRLQGRQGLPKDRDLGITVHDGEVGSPRRHFSPRGAQEAAWVDGPGRPKAWIKMRNPKAPAAARIEDLTLRAPPAARSDQAKTWALAASTTPTGAEGEKSAGQAGAKSRRRNASLWLSGVPTCERLPAAG